MTDFAVQQQFYSRCPVEKGIIRTHGTQNLLFEQKDKKKNYFFLKSPCRL